MAAQTYDAIVVGSGISGGWAAKELTEKGLKVLLLERGKDVEHIKDYKNATKDPWELPYHGRNTQEMIMEHPIFKKDALFKTANVDWWAPDKDCPYIEKKPFDWFRGYQVGGRSLLWGRHSYRWSDIDFEANAKEGIAVDWPIRYKDIAPWYDYTEKFAGISGSLEGLPQLPDGQFLPAMELNCVEKDVAARIKKKYNDERRLIIGRVANLTAPLNGRSSCQYRNKCELGCPYGAYFSSQSSTLPYAFKTGNLTLRPFSIVRRILYDKDKKKAAGVEIIDAETNKTYEYKAKIIFINASAFNSAWILMNSATDLWPGGLGSACGELGHNVMDHHINAGASGNVEGYEDKYYYGRRPTGFYIPRFRNIFNDKREYHRGFGYQGSASRTGWSRDVAELGIGNELKNALTEPGNWTIGMSGFGETLPYHENSIYLDKEKKDKWGLPVLVMDCKINNNEKMMRLDMVNDAVEMLESSGVKNVVPYNRVYIYGRSVHEMGTARMGNDPKTSVLNKNNQVWDAQNVFITDGACMASSACVNPSLTYMALTARACDFAANELKKGNL